MLTVDTIDRVDRAIRFLKRAEWTGWGKVPEYRAPDSLIPEYTLQRREPAPLIEDDYARTQAAKAARRARVYVAQQRALDAPFEAIAKAKATSGGVEAHRVSRARSARDTLGLVSYATSGTQTHGEARRPPREKLLINRNAQRVKRMRTTVGHSARLLHFDAHGERDAQRWNKKFITLTYANGDDWRPGHFSKFRDALRQWCKRRKVKCRFVWVAELQKRGALHYHVVVWLPKGEFLPFADAQGWWPHGSTNIKTAQSPIGYIMKYASKTTSAEAGGYPRGARMHGHGGLDTESRRHVRYWMAPIWVRDALSGRADIRKVVGGYMDKFTGEFLASPWRVSVGPGGEVWAYRVDQTETMQ
ncbi:hypothetical protein KK141_19460 [Dyella sp. LX-66]|uniref:rolling circle replication-associated protein n=1 Tax=unclassified Dyella TaxID=2634549 RepID=UPI001BE070C6|nr:MULTISPECIES: hypothetical protein [unclassified Dyella]MBT2119549.1 hypothetical protein [Dyella sp. LX-1]MBT2141735.1 hypothetical protein [Dyella sp. LX-66]